MRPVCDAELGVNAHYVEADAHVWNMVVALDGDSGQRTWMTQAALYAMCSAVIWQACVFTSGTGAQLVLPKTYAASRVRVDIHA